MVVILGLLLAACSSRAAAPAAPIALAPPAADEAVVVFMRPSSAGEMYSTSLFELHAAGDRFVGTLKGQSRLAYRVKPGRTRFMVVSVGGSDHYIDADLAGGKTYFAIVEYGATAGRAQYILRPMTAADQQDADFKACSAVCPWVENNERSLAWARQHMAEIARRKARSLPAWESQPDRRSLTAADGR